MLMSRGRAAGPCGSFTFRLHLTRAKVVGDTLRAATLEGHLSRPQAEQLGHRATAVDSTVYLVLDPSSGTRSPGQIGADASTTSSSMKTFPVSRSRWGFRADR